MALVITGDLTSAVAKQGSFIEITTTDLDMTGYDTDSLFVLSTAPTKGSLYLGSTLLAEDDTFTRAQYILNKLYYRHAGADTDPDSFGIIARQPPSTDTAESTVDVTVSAGNNGWLLRAVPQTNPAFIVAYMSSDHLLNLASLAWNNTHWGTSSVEEITDSSVAAWIETIIALDEDKFVKSFVNDARDHVNGALVFEQAKSLFSELDKAAYASLKILVATHGADIELDDDVWASLTEAEQSSWEKIKTDLSISTTRRVQIPNADWYGSVDSAQSMIISE